MTSESFLPKLLLFKPTPEKNILPLIQMLFKLYFISRSIVAPNLNLKICYRIKSKTDFSYENGCNLILLIYDRCTVTIY